MRLSRTRSTKSFLNVCLVGSYLFLATHLLDCLGKTKLYLGVPEGDKMHSNINKPRLGKHLLKKAYNFAVIYYVYAYHHWSLLVDGQHSRCCPSQRVGCVPS